MTNTIPDSLDFNSEELFNPTKACLLGQAESRTYFNPDFFEFFPQMQPMFDNNAFPSPSSYQPSRPYHSSTSNNSPYCTPAASPTYSSLQESPPNRHASLPNRLASPSYGPSIPPNGPSSPSYGPASPTYRTSSPYYGPASPTYRSSSPSYGPVPPLTCPPSSPEEHQSLFQNHPAHPFAPSPPSSGRSSPYDRKLSSSSSSSYARQEFPEITDMDSFARYLLGATAASEEYNSIFGENAHLAVAQPVNMSEDNLSCVFYTPTVSQKDLGVSQSPRSHQLSKESSKARKSQITQSLRGSPSHRVCCQCGTMETSLWRKDASGKPLCNACKLYYKVNI